jgi:hypothetical protein
MENETMEKTNLTTVQIEKPLHKKTKENKPKQYSLRGFYEVLIELGLAEFKKQTAKQN